MPAAYLKIENPGVAPVEAFTLLGASTKRGEDASSATIGKYGSGNKHGVATLLRHGLPPIVYPGKLCLNFATRSQVMDDGLKTTEFARVVVKYGGTDLDGKSRTRTEDLGYVLEYGASDWTTVDLALREFVSNSIDRAVEEGEVTFVQSYLESHPTCSYKLNEGDSQDQKEAKYEIQDALALYRTTARDYKNVKIEVVNENQVRAAVGGGTTRVFVPMNEDVLRFFNDLGKWFLHFSEPESLGKSILPKKNRNLGNRKAAVIYRRGVRVREFESSDVPSLFDYNLDRLEMDEARKVDDWRVRFSAARALRDGSKEQVAVLMQSFVSGEKFWEHDFDTYGLEADQYDSTATIAARSTVWTSAFRGIAGEEGVLSTPDGGQQAARKGYNVVKAPLAFVKAAGQYGVKTPDKVLTQDDREGREVIDATPDSHAVVDLVWQAVIANGMTNGKDRPSVKTFRKVMEGGSQTLGFYRDGTVYFNADIAGYGSLEVGQHALSQQLIVTALEEIAHHVTQSVDFVRDFQDYILNFAVKLLKTQTGIL